jgi:predicted CopG family antitoxin
LIPRSEGYTFNNYIQCVKTSVAAKTIALDHEAYALLAKSKRPGETFSDVVKRTVRPRRPLTDFAGVWKGMDRKQWTEINAVIAKGRRPDVSRRRNLE